MTAKFATRNAIISFIRVVPYPRPRQKIIDHMQKFFGTRPATTRQQLHKLCRACIVTQVDKDFYQVSSDGPEDNHGSDRRVQRGSEPPC